MGDCLLLFYSLLRKGSVLPNSVNMDTSKILCRSDVKFHPWGMMITVRTTKTIQFQERVLSIPIPRHRSSVLCPVQAMVHALTRVTSRGTSPAFVVPAHQGVLPVSGPMFGRRLQECLQGLPIDSSRISGHSFRRGGASWMYQVGVPTETIRALGDWKSSAYLQYITVSPNKIFSAIKTMQINH